MDGKTAVRKSFEDGTYPYPERMKRKKYEQEKEPLQIEMVRLQKWIHETGQRLVLVFEGRDAAGKGGMIKAITEHLNPRVARVVALAKPNETERGEWYFQRYVNRMPTKGEIVLFDRSWYNRAGVERVMGFCTTPQFRLFMAQAPAFERMLIDDGIHLFKYWLAISQHEQLRRFERRRKDPLKQWKMSPMDIAAVDKWDDYTEAREDMFAASDTPFAPWVVVNGEDKHRARLATMRHLLSKLDYEGKKPDVIGTPDPKILENPTYD
jgi:polyphosphate kinase 2